MADGSQMCTVMKQSTHLFKTQTGANSVSNAPVLLSHESIFQYGFWSLFH